MHVRPYRPEDFASLYVIEEACFEPPLRFSRRYIRQLVANPQSATWVAEYDGQLAGFLIVDWAAFQGSMLAYIQTIEVAPEFRRRGIALQLLRHAQYSAAQARATHIWLHVVEDNHSAIRLYESEGFRRTGVQQDYYGPGIVAAIYSKPIPPVDAA